MGFNSGFKGLNVADDEARCLPMEYVLMWTFRVEICLCRANRRKPTDNRHHDRHAVYQNRCTECITVNIL